MTQQASTLTGSTPDDILEHLVRMIAEAPVILEVHFGTGDTLPERQIFVRPDALARFLSMLVRPGDTVRAWRFDESCPPERARVAAVVRGASGPP